MMFVAKLRVVDRRDPKPEDAKEKDKPEEGWRNKSGVTKISPDLRVEADTMADAVGKVHKVVGKLDKDKLGDVVDLTIERETPPEETSAAWGIES